MTAAPMIDSSWETAVIVGQVDPVSVERAAGSPVSVALGVAFEEMNDRLVRPFLRARDAKQALAFAILNLPELVRRTVALHELARLAPVSSDELDSAQVALQERVRANLGPEHLRRFREGLAAHRAAADLSLRLYTVEPPVDLWEQRRFNLVGASFADWMWGSTAMSLWAHEGGSLAAGVEQLLVAMVYDAPRKGLAAAREVEDARRREDEIDIDAAKRGRKFRQVTAWQDVKAKLEA